MLYVIPTYSGSECMAPVNHCRSIHTTLLLYIYQLVYLILFMYTGWLFFPLSWSTHYIVFYIKIISSAISICNIYFLTLTYIFKCYMFGKCYYIRLEYLNQCSIIYSYTHTCIWNIALEIVRKKSINSLI